MREQPRELAVGEDGGRHVVDLCGEHDVAKPAFLEVAHERDGALHELLGLREVLARVDGAVERPGVHTDADGDARLSRSVNDGVNLLERADVAGVDAQGRGASPCRLDGQAVVEVDVGYDGQGRLAAYLAEAIERIGVRDSHAHDLAPEVGEVANLRNRGRGVGGLGGAHGLDGHGGTAANGDRAHVNLMRKLARQGRALLGREAKVEHD